MTTTTAALKEKVGQNLTSAFLLCHMNEPKSRHCGMLALNSMRKRYERGHAASAGCDPVQELFVRYYVWVEKE
jgi:hypothetical protein